MFARDQLNLFYLGACFISASLVGLVLSSPAAFVVTGAILVGLSCRSGRVR